MRYIFLFFLLLTSIFAHKLNIFYVNEKNKIYFNTYFASGSACQNCDVKIFDENKKLIKTLTTDKKGEFIVENLNNFFVKVETLGGHAAEEKVFIDKKITNSNPKEVIKNNNEKIQKNSIIETIIAIIAIFFIFYLLKRFRKNERV